MKRLFYKLFGHRWIEEFCAANDVTLPKYKLVSSEQFPEVFK